MHVSIRRRGDPAQQIAALLRAEKTARTTAMRRTGAAAESAMRRTIGAKLGARMARTLRARVFPESGIASNPKLQIRSTALVKRPGGVVDLLTVFRLGAVIHPVHGAFLLIGRRLSKAAGLVGRLARSREVKILPRIQELDADFERIARTLPDAVARERASLIGRAR